MIVTTLLHHVGMRENPWRTLRSRPWIKLEWADLPDGMHGMWGGTTITLSNRATRVERRCALMHELIHAERGIGWGYATAETMQTEERIVRVQTALRLVPLDELALFVDRREFEPITAGVIAREFDVTPKVAALAADLLVQRIMEAA